LSADKSLLIFTDVGEAARGRVSVVAVSTSTMGVIGAGTLRLPDMPRGSLIIAEPVIAGASGTVAVVLAMTVPSNPRSVEKVNPRTGQKMRLVASTWTSSHALAYFNVRAGTLIGPLELRDAPSLALCSAVADNDTLYLWTVAEAAAMPSWKGRPGGGPVPQLAAYPLGSADPRFAVDAPGQWPVGSEPLLAHPSGHVLRLLAGRHIQAFSSRSGRMSLVKPGQLAVPSAKLGSASMDLAADGLVVINNPVIGAAVLVDPGRSFRVVAETRYPPPAVPFGGPAAKAALGPDGLTLYVLGPAASGGLSAYDLRTGRQMASFSDGQNFGGVRVLTDGTVVAVGLSGPQLFFFTPELKLAASANAGIVVREIY